MTRFRLLTLMLVATGASLLVQPVFAATVHEVKTPGGITAWLIEEHSQPLIAVSLAFKHSGSAYDASGKEGLAEALTALLTEGSGDMDADAFNRAVEDRAIRLSAGNDVDMVSVGMQTLSEHREIAFSYLGTMLTQPRFDDSAIERVKAQMRTALTQQESDAYGRLQRGWQVMMFGDHPYGRNTLGSNSSIASISKSDLRDAAKKRLTRDHMIVAVVGDITPDELSLLLDTKLGALSAKATDVPEVSDVKIEASAKQQVIEQDIPQTMVMFGLQGLKRSDPEFMNGFVMNHIIGSGTLTSRLGEEIREKRGLAYTISTQLQPLGHGGAWLGMFATRNEKAAESLKVLRETLARFAAEGPTAGELETAKNYLIGSFTLALDSNAELAAFLVNMQVNALGIDYLDKRNDQIRAVTKEGIAQLAKRLIDPDKLRVVMVGKPVLTDAPASKENNSR
jgi:zinc protease